jgi:hypothetical protein
LKPRACSCPRAEPSTASCRVFGWTTRRIFSRLYGGCMAVLKTPSTLAPCARRRQRRPALCARPAASPACRDAPPPPPGLQPPPAAAPASPPGPRRARRGPGPMRATLRAKHPAAIRISRDAMGATPVSGKHQCSGAGTGTRRAPGRRRGRGGLARHGAVHVLRRRELRAPGEARVDGERTHARARAPRVRALGAALAPARPGQEPPVQPVKRPARRHKSAIHNRFTRETLRALNKEGGPGPCVRTLGTAPLLHTAPIL